MRLHRVSCPHVGESHRRNRSLVNWLFAAGSIPANLGALVALQTLSLGGNQLSGKWVTEQSTQSNHRVPPKAMSLPLLCCMERLVRRNREPEPGSEEGYPEFGG